MKIHAFKAYFADKKKIKDLPAFCDDIKRNFSSYKWNGFFTKPVQDKIYVTEINTQEKIFHGIICLIDYEEMEDNVLKHEDTKVKKEKEVMTFLTSNKTMVKPVLLAINKITKLDVLISEVVKKTPTHSYKFANETHKYWALSEEDQIILTDLLSKKLDVAYIADGHHRFSTIFQLLNRGRIHNSRGIFSALFSFEQLEIKSFTRVVKDKKSFMDEMKKYGTISIMEMGIIPDNNKTINFFYRGLWYTFQWNKTVLNASKSKLNIEIFTKKILKDIFHITDERTSSKIEYLEGNMGISEIEDVATMDKIYFTFNPISKKEFIEIIDAGKYLPPKATWFLPRIKSGLINTEL